MRSRVEVTGTWRSIQVDAGGTGRAGGADGVLQLEGFFQRKRRHGSLRRRLCGLRECLGRKRVQERSVAVMCGQRRWAGMGS